MSAKNEEQARAKGKRWPIRRFRLGEEPGEDLSALTTPEERLAMMWELAARAWRLAGLPFPNDPRHRIPGRVVRRSP